MTAAAVAFLVVSTLFDVMSFPHCPYILLWLAALLTVAMEPEDLMDLLSVWRQLLRARLWLGPVLLVAAVAAGAVLGLPPLGSAAPAPTGAARARALVDMPFTLVADLRARTDTIGAQAALLSDLLATDEGRAVVARGSGVPERELIVLRPAATNPTKVSPLADDASVVASTPSAYTLTVETSTTLPIVTFGVTAPDRARAARVAAAAVTALQRLAAERAAGPPRALRVRSLEPVRGDLGARRRAPRARRRRCGRGRPPRLGRRGRGALGAHARLAGGLRMKARVALAFGMALAVVWLGVALVAGPPEPALVATRQAAPERVLRAVPDTLDGVFAQADAGETIELAAGQYGTFRGAMKLGTVVLKPAPGATVTIAVEFNPAANVTLEDLHITHLEIGDARSHDIVVRDSRFDRAQAIIRTGELSDAGILFERNVHDGYVKCQGCYEGRLHLVGRTGRTSGVTIRDSVFARRQLGRDPERRTRRAHHREHVRGHPPARRRRRSPCRRDPALRLERAPSFAAIACAMSRRASWRRTAPTTSGSRTT